MRKTVVFILALAAMAVLISGCGRSAAPTPTPTQPLPTLPLSALATDTPEPTATFTPTPTPTKSPTPTRTPTPRATRTRTRTPTSTPTPTPTPSPTATRAVALRATPVDATALPTDPYDVRCVLNPECVPAPAEPIERLQNTENILLLGTDRREGWGNWRTDTIMLAIIDWETNQVAVVSFPRDLYVYHPVFGRKRINAFDYLAESRGYEGGGFQVMKEIFEYNFGIPIHHVVRVHRGAFVEFVDAIGGIQVTLDCDLWQISPQPDGNGYKVLYLPAGTHVLDGETALEFATYRYRTNDWGRARRQHQVLAALKDQAAQLGLLAKAPQIWDIIKRNVSSDLGFTDMLRYAKFALDMDMGNIHSHVFSGRELDIVKLPSGAEVLLPKNREVMPEVLENIFLYVPINVQGTHPKGCPPPPVWADDYLASLTPTPPPQQ
jgi:LCP family protein required for cell wall assembly